jgi:HlyD family secretion protein
MRRILRILGIVVVLSFIAVVAVQLLQAQGSATPAAADTSLIQDEAVVVQDDLAVTVTGTDALTPIRQVNLMFEMSGVVTEILAEEGAVVSTGDMLARLDTADLEAALRNAEIALESQQIAFQALIAPPRTEDIAAAEAAVNTAQASVNAAAQGPTDAEIEIARMRLELARNDLWQAQMNRDAILEIPPEFRGPFANVEELQLNSGLQSADYNIFIADANLQALLNSTPDLGPLSEASAALVQAQVALERLLDGPSEMDLQMAEIDLQTAQLAVEQARTSLTHAVLVAPFDGVVAANNLVVGEVPPSQDSAVEMIDPTSYYIDLPIDETDIVSVQVGQPVNLAFDALPGADITGTVTRVAVTPTRVGQLVTYTVRVTLDPTNEPVRVGMSATATIIVNELHDVLVLPNRFIRIDRATQDAFVTIQRDDGAFEEIPVVLGLRNETHAQIVSGLEEDQRVVLLPREAFNPLEGG